MVWYIGECMVATININNGVNFLPVGILNLAMPDSPQSRLMFELLVIIIKVWDPTQ